ncbi:MAG: BRCT domain-containing protein [Candidatus Xenobia bacterium]
MASTHAGDLLQGENLRRVGSTYGKDLAQQGRLAHQFEGQAFAAASEWPIPAACAWLPKSALA